MLLEVWQLALFGLNVGMRDFVGNIGSLAGELTFSGHGNTLSKGKQTVEPLFDLQ